MIESRLGDHNRRAGLARAEFNILQHGVVQRVAHRDPNRMSGGAERNDASLPAELRRKEGRGLSGLTRFVVDVLEMQSRRHRPRDRRFFSQPEIGERPAERSRPACLQLDSAIQAGGVDQSRSQQEIADKSVGAHDDTTLSAGAAA